MIMSRLRQGSCRLCLWESNCLWDIFGELAERRNFARKIQACVNISVSKDDGLSPLICSNCIYKIELFSDFQASCKRSDEIQKRYNGFQDVGRADRDAVEDVFPVPALQCAVSNSHKDAQGPVELIDIKEEPIDDEEMAVDGADHDQFQDAEVEIEEVVAVTENGGIAATEQQQKEKETDREKEGDGGVGNGSCLQLTPPRSPSLASEVTCSASEAGGSADRESSEQQREEEESGLESSGAEGGGGGSSSCRHCAKWLPDPRTRREHEAACPRRASADHPQQPQTQGGQPGLQPPPPAKYPNRCRFCAKLFHKAGGCRAHEQECGPLHGFAAPPLPTGRAGTRCRFCSMLFVSKAGRSIHEYHCFRRERRAQSAAPRPSEHAARRELPPPPKYCNQCRYCHKYFPRVPPRRIHETQCGRRLGYLPPATPLGQPQSQPQEAPSAAPAEPAGETKCSACGKQFRTTVGRAVHEHNCRRPSLPTRHNLAATQCRYCHTRFLTRSQRLSHELSCAKASGWSDGPKADVASRSGGQDVVKCRYCGKGHLKWRSLLTHEFHCRRKAPPRPEADTEVAVAQPVREDANLEVAVSDCGTADDDVEDRSSSVAETTASEESRRGPPNRCSYCNKWFKTKQACKLHEFYCSRSGHVTVRGRYVCSYCPRLFLKLSACITHERHCLQRTARKGDSGAASLAVSSGVPEQNQNRQQLASTTSDAAQSNVGSTDRREVICATVSESERTRKKIDNPLCIPVADSTSETDIWMCRYCDKTFKYRECLRTHEVKCGAIATYQYSTPHHRPPSYFTCPLCRKAFKFRRKLHNHWKVCKARTSVVAEAAELNGRPKSAQSGPDRSEENGGVMALFSSTSSPGEDREEWRGWPSSHSQTVVDLLTDEDSGTTAVDLSGLSCKLCNKDFCSRVLLELHTLNECVYQRIRNDHAYAQCESPSVDESTLMRMARVELQRLLLCSCCGSIFSDRQALAEHEHAERCRHSRTQTEAEEPLQRDPEATHLQKKIKLGNVVDELDLKLENGDQQESSCWAWMTQTEAEVPLRCDPGATHLQNIKPGKVVNDLVLKLESRGQQESNCRAEQLTTKDQAVTTTVKKPENADTIQGLNKNCLLQNILLGGIGKKFLQKVASEKQIKDEVDIKQQERQQLESLDGAASNNLVLPKSFRNSSNYNQEQYKEGPDKKFSSVDSSLEQGSRTVVVHPRYQECSSDDHKQQPQNKMPNLAHLLQQQLEDPSNRQSGQNNSEDNQRDNQCPKITASLSTVQCHASKNPTRPQGLCNGLDHPSTNGSSAAAVSYVLP